MPTPRPSGSTVKHFAACPVGCGRTRNEGHLLCGPCWAVVPPFLKDEVNHTWRAWTADWKNPDLMRDYRAASEKALASLR